MSPLNLKLVIDGKEIGNLIWLGNGSHNDQRGKVGLIAFEQTALHNQYALTLALEHSGVLFEQDYVSGEWAKDEGPLTILVQEGGYIYSVHQIEITEGDTLLSVDIANYLDEFAQNIADWMDGGEEE